MGPCARLGLFTGGGYPHSRVCLGLRAIPGWKKVWEIVARQEGSWCSHLPQIVPHQAMFASTKDQPAYSGLHLHKDNAVVPGAPEVFHNQGALLIFPPPQNYLRSGCLTSLFPATDACYRDTLVSIAARACQCETGQPAKGPLDRPAPKTILGGKYVRRHIAKEMTEKDLYSFCKKQCRSDLVSALPGKPGRRQLDLARKEFLRVLSESIGPAISSEATLSREWGRKNNGDSSRKSLMMRALAGGLRSDILWRVFVGCPNNVAIAVFEEAERILNPSLILRWVANSGRRRRKADESSTLDVGVARKRAKHM